MPEARPSLDAIFRPRSIAVIGASRRKGSIGRELLRNLLGYEFNGKVFPVNPKADVIHSMKVYSTVLQIYDEIDLAVIVVPKQFVLQALDDCGRKGVKGVVVLSAGFREVGIEGRKREDELVEICRKYGMRMVGPNCMGVVNTEDGICMNATFAPSQPLKGNLGFLSQSGAMGVAILEHAQALNLGYSMFISMGNKADVNTIDVLEYWEDDEDTKVVLMYLESFGDPRRFTSLARRIVRKKPVLCVKSGRTLAGARAAVSHTGALAGLDVAVDALFEQTGILRVDTVEELFDVAMAFSNQPIPNGDRVAILTDAGGPAIMATDAVISSGMHMAELSDVTKEKLHEILPEEASVANPVDMLGHSTEDHYRTALPMLLEDPGVDAVITLYVPPVMHDPIRVAKAIFEAAEGTTKPVMCCFMARGDVLEGIQDLGTKFPIYEFPESAVRALAMMIKYGRYRDREAGDIPDVDVDRERAAAIFDGAQEEDRDYLTTMEAFEVLEAYGIPVADHRLCTSADEAAAFADECGYPVVVKLMSPTISHKSDYGGVVVDLRSADEVKSAVEMIGKRVAEADQEIVVDGFLVQQMVRGGKETILGLSTDPVFGPLVMFGMGGIYVEVLKDVSFRLVPITETDADEMMRSIRAWPLLEGVRGESGVRLDRVKDALLRCSRLVQDFRRIVEFDVNPFIAHEDEDLCRAVDVRFRLRRERVREAGFRIRFPPGHAPVLAPLSPQATGADAEIRARSEAVGAGVDGGEIVLADTSPSTLDALARALEELGGRVLAMPGPDVPFEVFTALAKRTDRVVGVVSGDPSPYTALGALAAILAGRGDLDGARVGVLGAGRVGGRLAGLLAEAGARVFVSDLDRERAEAVATAARGRIVDPEAFLGQDLDVLSPNARGVVIETADVPRLRCGLVAGGANGPLGPGAADALAGRGIAVVPEEIAGSGWLLALAAELRPGEFDRTVAERMVAGIEEKARCWLSKA